MFGYVCLCIRVCTCVGTCVSRWVHLPIGPHVCGDLRLTWDVFFNVSLLYIMKKGELGAYYVGNMAGQLPLGSHLYLLPAGITGRLPYLPVLMWILGA